VGPVPPGTGLKGVRGFGVLGFFVNLASGCDSTVVVFDEQVESLVAIKVERV